ncbi:pentapeptide repeat-containing protein [Aurantimicrobium minutum]|uniref:pentapeptide repeat-containing protein n=1 Tax=Aurantimicrobium minutum TaxID=708131 RepID=UPI0024730993|nr:pentapeptide repeat-containing protein [Aurantimicrobium minutum]
MSISGVDFSTAYLAGAQFGPNGPTFTTLSSVAFGNNSSHGVNFNHAHITGSTFYLSDMASSDFADTVLTGSTFHFAHLEGSSFINADFTGVTIINSWLGGANLSYSNITQAQLDDAILTPDTICPDTYPLGEHVGNCFSALKAPLPTVTAPVIGSNGFTFDITNNDPDYYTFTVAVTAGPGVATLGTPSGSTLPVNVTNAPPGSQTVVTITGSIGSGASQVVSSTTYNYQEQVASELARTGLNNEEIHSGLLVGASLLVLGMGALVISRRIRTSN